MRHVDPTISLTSITSKSGPPPPARDPGRAEGATGPRPIRSTPEPVHARHVRVVAWVALVALGALQALAGRFALSPDGMAYLDISDAVLAGQWREFLNAYWSPLYPLVIGVLRALLRVSAYWENTIPHLASFLFFIASIRAFEYFLAGVAASAEAWGKGRFVVGDGWQVAAYAFFGVFSLVMTPLTLTTPDVAVSVFVYLALGALLRLRLRDSGQAAPILGLALAAGTLTKSFMIPWAVICLAVALMVTRPRARWRTALLAGGPWLAVATAWTLALSAHVERPTFGDTGRLTYAWFVNMKVQPSSGVMPPATAHPAVDSLLSGVAVTGEAHGTNPVWYDPAQWYGDVDPELDLAQQGRVLLFLTSLLSAALAPLLFVLSVAVAASFPHIRALVARIWPVALPALAGIAGYTLILVATRYVVAFVVALAIVLLAAVDWPRRIGPWPLAVGLLIPAALVWPAAEAQAVFAMQAAVLAAVLVAFGLRGQPFGVRLTVAIAGGLATRIILPPAAELGSVAFVAAVFVMVLVAVAAERTGSDAELARVIRRWGLSATAVVLLFASAKKYGDSIRPLWAAGDDPHSAWATAERLDAAGIERRMAIAIVGSPFEAYWARAWRVRIVAVIPPAKAIEFWELPEERREAIVSELRASGAEALVVTMVPAELARDPDWQAVYPRGVRLLR